MISSAIVRALRDHAASVFILASSLILFFLPLFRDFDYEFNQALAIVVFLASGIRAAGIVGSTQGQRVWATVKMAARGPAITLFGVGLIGTLLVVRSECLIVRSALWFLLLPIPALLVGTASGLMAGTVSQKHPYLVFGIFCTASLAYNVWVLYVNVPIAVHSVFWGYYSGPVYDEFIPITMSLYFSRALSVVWAMMFLATGWLLRVRGMGQLPRAAYGAIILGTVVVGTGYYFRSTTGTDLTYADLNQLLTGQDSTAHVELRYDPRLNMRDVQILAQRAEFAIHNISGLLGITYSRRIRLYLYHDEFQKKELMGAGSTNFAKVWRDEIHLNAEDASSVLAHELTHIVAREFAHPLFSTHRVGFLEGLAVAAAWDDSYMTPHEWAAALRRLERLPDIRPLVGSTAFFTSSARLSYVVMGSFVRFLIETRGSEKFKQAYYQEEFESAYGVSIDDMMHEWQMFLDSVEVRQVDLELAHVLLQPGVFQRRCVHGVADLMHRADQAMRDGEWDRAMRIHDRIVRLDPAHSEALFAKIRALSMAGRWKEARSLVDSARIQPHWAHTTRAALDLLRADLMLSFGMGDSARRAYDHIISDHSYHRRLVLGAMVRRDLAVLPDGPQYIRLVLGAVTVTERISALECIPDSIRPSSTNVWLGRLHLEEGDYEKARRVLSEPADGIWVEYERLWRLSQSAMYLDRLSEAVGYLDRAVNLTDQRHEQLDCEREIAFISWMIQRKSETGK